jgi:hypothetical protein
MAETKLVADLDKKLMEEGIIDPSFMEDYKKVHGMLNTHVRKTGRILSEETFEKGDQKLRKWLIVLYKQGAPQEKLSSYLRCGLAHLCFDFIESSYKAISNDDLIARAIQSFKMRNFHKTYFKVSPNEIKAQSGKRKKTGKKPAKKTSKKKARKAPLKKKLGKKKISRKNVSKKRIIKKKAVKKKTVPKKTKGKKKRKARKSRSKKGLFSMLFG